MLADKTLDSRRIAIYARFSSERQRETSIDDQVHRCRAYIERNGGDPSKAQVFADYAISGASLDRPGFESLMSAVDKGHVDVILTEDISRISRDFADAAQLFKRLQYERIPLISIADGIDTSTQDAKLSFTLKSLVADLYLDDLRDKTRRGLEGRFRAGYAAGPQPLGYTTEPEHDARGNVLGRRIVIEPQGAAVVRRIFEMYCSGQSVRAIGRKLARDGIRPVRGSMNGPCTSWNPSTINRIIANEKYVGIFRHGREQATKVPGSNKRTQRKRDESEILTVEHPELRIVDHALWNAAQQRRNAGRAPHKKSHYLLSGLIHCGHCGATMSITVSSQISYYRCSNNRLDRGCDNNMGIREQVARTGVLARLRVLLGDQKIIAHMRKEIARKLKDIAVDTGNDLTEHRQRLRRTEARIGRLIEHLADGNRSEYVRESLRNLEAEASTHKQTIATLEQRSRMPRELPSVDQIMSACLDLDAILRLDVKAGREHLRRLFQDGQIHMFRQGRAYIARSRVYPFALGVVPGSTQTHANDLAVFHGHNASGMQIAFALPWTSAVARRA